jgi:hypothetical protein
MGRFAKPASGGITKYYWYPGERSDWIRAAIAAGCGILTIILVAATTGSHLWASVLGASVTAGVAGVTFGRKDVRALQTFAGFAALDTGRAVWRAAVKGFGAAAAAVLVVHAANGVGFVASWLLPVVPAIVGAIAHQAGMMYERASQAAAEQEALAESVAEPEPVAAELEPEPAPALVPSPVSAQPVYSPAPSPLLAPSTSFSTSLGTMAQLRGPLRSAGPMSQLDR